ncbi:hypothetical protein [Mycolicibacterium sp.]|uniref:hypothetical protein n=1 Tax=Mycolicibacterium sp. TaxID=2320850 RepID=UPI0037C74FC8
MSDEYDKNLVAVDMFSQERISHTAEASTEWSHAPTTECEESGSGQVRRWRESTRGLVLAGATATATADSAKSERLISISLSGNALSNDVLLADTGVVVLASHHRRAAAIGHPMRVIPMRLDMLSYPPVVRVQGWGLTAPTRVLLLIELTARNPNTGTTSVMRCEYDSVVLAAEEPRVVLVFNGGTNNCICGDHAVHEPSSTEGLHR